ncbi:dihydrofolate reductase family protein [Actinosynnema sp. NPDC047251]|uniref:Dihydrofolate reductase n=1 Tax=Saccharothrix espanaensis (strain ATCC 51144 / DSM 44229 / JCM 9112 / NBRC 15066 / NRRL 15764) TaxID=1179773 RepID=K0JRC2_SACES|nr:dihydrofolate reductase family protein [Saccharothrix espanaensis]CCH27344.1 Dihydrofolate reductase [Saccharothrix espanaensis DSM 44229]
MGLVTCGVAVSVDGYVAGPGQSFDTPLGAGGEQLHRWMFEQGDRHPAELRALTSAGAYVMGRNMFTSGRGEWDLDWRGWWGDEPPYHGPVFVLTHFPREPVEMLGGTTFHFVTDGIGSALRQARAAAGDRDVSIAGGAATVNQYLAAGLLDELWLHIAPVVLGSGERLFTDVGDLALEPVEVRGTDLVTHVRYRIGQK